LIPLLIKNKCNASYLWSKMFQYAWKFNL